MNITKLTLTPIISHAPSIHIKNPTPESAVLLMKERLLCDRQNGYPRKKLKVKLPACLKGFINPATYVGPAKNTT